MTEFLFTLRPLAGQAHIGLVPTLAGAFHIHISPENLKVLGLRPGDICQLRTSDGAGGLGIAWPSHDLKNANRIAKITDTLKDTHNLNFQDRVRISKHQGTFTHAAKVWVTNVTQDSNQDEGVSSEELEYWVHRTLSGTDAIAPNCSFEAIVRRGPWAGSKRRFIIEKIEPSSPPGEHFSVPWLFDFRSKVEFPRPQVQQKTSFEIGSQGIGGLQKQIQQLNKRLSALNDDLRRLQLPLHIKRSPGILLHGPSGTGKTLLLSKIARAPWRKVLHVNNAILGPFLQQSQKTLRSIFDEAVNEQPSVILIDGLEHIAGKPERDSSSTSLGPLLAAELDKIRGMKVMVIGTTVQLSDVDNSLRKPGRFRYEIEIPVPDSNARIEILRVLQGIDTSTPDPLSQEIGERTHGFVGQDLEALYETALEKAFDRYENELNFQQLDGSEAMSTKASPSHQVVNGIEDPSREEESSDDQPNNTDARGTPDGGSAQRTLKVLLEDFEAALHEVHPTAMKEVFLETPKVRWTDIGGSDDVKNALYKVTERPFKRPDLMRDLKLEPHRGILLYGPPGCSKTLCAKAVATESGLNFIAIKGAELTSMYVGESERAIREVFRKARAASPSIIFFDEIDSIGSSRESGSQTSGLNVLTTLLNEMDGIESLKGVLVLAATNRPDILDLALLRPGRFDARIYVGPPSLEARKQILAIGNAGRPLADDIDIDLLGRATDGYSGAEIIQICHEAAEVTADDRERTGDSEVKISQKHFNAALEKIPRQITPAMVERYTGWDAGTSTKL